MTAEKPARTGPIQESASACHAYSGLKVFWHADKLRALSEGRHTPPVYVRIKPTNRCNHRCYYCSYQEDKRLVTTETMDPTDAIPFEKLCEILDDFRDMGVKAVTYSGGGEPLVYPRIAEIMRRTLSAGIDLSVITNGSLLSGQIAEALAQSHWTRVSMDSCDPETYARIRRVSNDEVSRVLKNMSDFAAIKDAECELGVNFVVCAENADQVYEACRTVREAGADHVKITAQNTPDVHGDHAPFKDRVIEQIARAQENLATDSFRVHSVYEADFEHAAVYQRAYSHCAIKEIVPVIGADARVYFCHDKTYTSTGVVGSLAEQSFKEMWFSEETIEKFRRFDAREQCRHHCTYDARNMLINDFLAANNHHINFV